VATQTPPHTNRGFHKQGFGYAKQPVQRDDVLHGRLCARCYCARTGQYSGAGPADMRRAYPHHTPRRRPTAEPKSAHAAARPQVRLCAGCVQPHWARYAPRKEQRAAPHVCRCSLFGSTSRAVSTRWSRVDRAERARPGQCGNDVHGVVNTVAVPLGSRSEHTTRVTSASCVGGVHTPGRVRLRQARVPPHNLSSETALSFRAPPVPQQPQRPHRGWDLLADCGCAEGVS